MEKKAIDDYYDALQRLINNKPLNIPKDSKINNDTVALEACRKRGSIKRSREGFEQLITDILEAEAKRTQGVRKLQGKLEKTKQDKINVEILYNESLKLNKEIILEKEAFSAFLDMSYPGNIGQLKSDIQVCCAKAFLESKINNSSKLRIKKEFIVDISNTLLIKRVGFGVSKGGLSNNFLISFLASSLCPHSSYVQIL